MAPRPPSEQAAWKQLLRQREHQALRMASRGRLAISGLGLMAVILTAQAGQERAMSASLVTGYLAGTLLLGWGLRSDRHLGALGLGGALLDSALIVVFPLIWHQVHTAADRPMVHLLGHQLTPLTFIAMVVNCAALRPAHPLLVAGVGAVVQVVLSWLAVHDPGAPLLDGGLSQILARSGRSEADMFLTAAIVFVAGVGLSLVTRGVRNLVGEVVQGELRQHRMREEQMQLMMQARVSALGQLVAGIAHEVNSPLASMRSAADTASRATTKLRQGLANSAHPDAKALERPLKTLEASVALSDQAGARLGEVIQAIKGFSHLDRGERHTVDLCQGLRDALEVVRPALDGSVRWQLELGDDCVVNADGSRLSQAFASLLRHGARRAGAAGLVSVTCELRDDGVQVQVQDDGPSLDEDALAGLFEVDFDSDTRVQAHFDLAICRSVVLDHGGEIRAESQRGVAIILWLPRSATLATPST